MKSAVIATLVSVGICAILVFVFIKMTEKKASEMGIKSTYSEER